MSTRRTRHALPRRIRMAGCACLALLAAGPVLALDTTREDVAAFVRDVAGRDGFDAAQLGGVLAHAESQPAIIDSIARPAEKTLTWQAYRARFITGKRIARGVSLAAGQSEALQHAAASGVPAAILLAITGIETFYGDVMGRYRVIDALTTLGFDYPPRGAFFRDQLEQFLLMAREEALDPLAPLGSYAGAMGIPQFMPGSFRAYAVDGDADGRRNLWSDWNDVFASVANYLVKNGWRPGEPVMAAADVTGANLDGMSPDKLALSETVKSLRDRGIKFETSLPADAAAVLIPLVIDGGTEYRVGFSNYAAITRYNRSEMYASAVYDLSRAIDAARTPAPFTTGPAPAVAPADPQTAPQTVTPSPTPPPPASTPETDTASGPPTEPHPESTTEAKQ